MKNKKYWISILILAIFALLIHFFSADAVRVERYYSLGIYPAIAVFLRYLLGWLPFSLGDIIYGLLLIWLLFRAGKAIRAIFRKQLFTRASIAFLLRVVISLLSIYVLFNLVWGINYNRQGIAWQLGLPMEKYSLSDLKALNGLLLQKANSSKNSLLQNPPAPISNQDIRDRSGAAYEIANQTYAFLNYHPASIKASLWGWLGNYIGFLGYYNPFTGEGQVNSTIPQFLQPYTTCHEIAHQLGYAKENEANFVGYLAASSSKDASFHYSAYLDLFLYANRNLYDIDSASARSFTKDLLPEVKNDLREWRLFNQQHKNPVEPVIRWMYGKYLENNQQPSGVLSYDEVTGFLVSYYKKFGRL